MLLKSWYVSENFFWYVKRIMQSKCAVCGIKKSRFVKEQKPKGLLSSLGLKTPLNKIPLLGDILF